MKKSFMTRVLAASLSTAMAFSLSPVGNLMTASAASTVQISTTFKTVKVGQSATLKLKNNTLDWKISKVTTTDKTICTVYGKTASNVKIKGKKVGRATITITTTSARRQAKGGVYTKNLKCRANVIAADTPAATFTASANATSANTVAVTFSEAVDAAVASNFAIDGVTVQGVELSADKKTATLTLSGAEAGKQYTLTTSGLTVNGAAVANQSVTFTTPANEASNTTLILTSDLEQPYLKSDGASSTVIKCEIRDKDGKIMEDADVEIRFTATRGNLGSERVTAQKGIAETTLRSEFLTANARSVITATVVESRTNPELINASGSMDITMTPNPDDYVATIGAVITSAESNQADRVTAFFNKNIDVDDYLYNNKEVNPSKAEIVVYDDVNNSGNYGAAKTVKVVGLLPVDGNPAAMQILLERPLTDNSNIGVLFRDRTGTQSTDNTVSFKLTDARQPAAVNVDNVGYRTIEADFSEPVLNKAAADKADTAKGIVNNPYTQYVADADPAVHFLIDGRPLDDSRYGSTANPAQATVGEYNAGVDNRDKVTIKLGRKSDGKRAYLEPGTHSLQIVKVGDWASNTDGANNVLQTQTLDFTVETNNTLPDIQSVVVQSPEQYLVTFTSPVDKSVKNEIRLACNFDGNWQDVTNYAPSSGTVQPSLKITPVGGSSEEFQQCIIEVREDWTRYFNTQSTKDNYYKHQFRLEIDKEKLENTDNGKLNSADIRFNLTDEKITKPDYDSPVIGDIEEKTDGDGTVYYSVPLSEPVKIWAGANGNEEGDTPAQLQGQIPTPTVSFIRESDYTTIEGTIRGFDTNAQNADNYHTVLRAEPNEPLSNGTWILVVRSISDDVGNTAASLTKPFEATVVSKEQTFRVLWSAVANEMVAQDSNGINGAEGIATFNDIICRTNYNGANWLNNKITEGRYIFVKFSDAIQVSGASQNVLATENYTLNGRPLPANTTIRANIAGYDGYGEALTDSITIILPENSTVNGVNTVLNISPAVQSKAGKTLAGDHELRLPYNVGYVHGNHSSDIDNTTTANDAIWGNDPSETADGKTLPAYMREVQAALDDDRYGHIILSQTITQGTTLKINRPVTIDMNGYDIEGNLEYNYTTSGRSEIINTSSLAVTVSGKVSVKTKNADFHVDATKGGTITLTNPNNEVEVYKNTFKNIGANIYFLSITGANSGVANTAGGRIGFIAVAASGAEIKNDATIASVDIQNKATGTTLTNNRVIESVITGATGTTITNNHTIKSVTTEATGTTIKNGAGATIENTTIAAAGATVTNNGTMTSTTVDTTGTVTLDGEGTFANVDVVKKADITVVGKATVETLTTDITDLTVITKDDAKVEAAPAGVVKAEGTNTEDPTPVTKDDGTTATNAADAYFESKLEVGTTSAGAISLVKADAVSGSAITISKITVNTNKEGTGNAGTCLSVDASVIGGATDTVAAKAVSVANRPTSDKTEYVIVEGIVDVDGKSIAFTKAIEVVIKAK